MFFIDYGNVDDIPFECIAAMPEEIASKGLCAQAMQCCLSGYTDHPCSAEDCEQLSAYFAVCSSNGLFSFFNSLSTAGLATPPRSQKYHF